MEAEIYILKLRELEKVTGLGKSTIYKLIQTEDFPAPVRLAERSVGWKNIDVFEWLKNRPYTHIPSQCNSQSEVAR